MSERASECIYMCMRLPTKLRPFSNARKSKEEKEKNRNVTRNIYRHILTHTRKTIFAICNGIPPKTFDGNLKLKKIEFHFPLRHEDIQTTTTSINTIPMNISVSMLDVDTHTRLVCVCIRRKRIYTSVRDECYF